jgi:hypothetical protein
MDDSNKEKHTRSRRHRIDACPGELHMEIEALESVPSSRAVTAGLAFRLREENELAMMKERRPDAITRAQRHNGAQKV